MDLKTLKQRYVTYSHYLEVNRDKYELADRITSEGIVSSHKGMSVGLMDNVFQEASLFYIEYECMQKLVDEMKDLGIDLVKGN